MHADSLQARANLSAHPGRMRLDGAARRHLHGPSVSVRDMISTYYDMSPLESDLNLGRFQMHNWFAPTCIFSQSDMDMVTVRRTKAQAEQGGHLVYIHRYFSGAVRGFCGDVSVDRDPGSVYVFDLERRVECVQFPTTARGILVPKWVIGYDPDRHPPFMEFPMQHAVGSLLQNLMDAMFDDLFAEDSIDPNDLDQFYAVLKLALGEDPNRGDVRRVARAALGRAMRAFIETNLASPHLNAHLLMQQFGVSRASLFRMFEPYGGVRQYLSNRRLYRAVLELNEKPLRRGDIVDIAERWNFSSHANFSRAVKRHFGAPPGGLVNLTGQERNARGWRAPMHAFTKRTQAAERLSA